MGKQTQSGADQGRDARGSVHLQGDERISVGENEEHQGACGQGEGGIDACGAGAIDLRPASNATNARRRCDLVESMRKIAGMTDDQ